jgi:hypothetical protein
MTTDAANNAELDALSEARTAPRDRECITCYVLRMLDQFGCDSQLRWAKRWRDGNAPRAVMLLPSLESRGGYCDCEMLFHVYRHALPAEDEPLPPCPGVRRGSTQPCRMAPLRDCDSWEDDD